MKKSTMLIVLLLSISIIITSCTNPVDEKDAEIPEKENINIDSPKETSDEKKAEWPVERMGDLPEPQAKVISVTELEGEGSMYLVLEFDDPNSGKDYLEKLISMGYEKVFSGDGENFVTYTGAKRDNSEIVLMYRLDDEPGSLIYTEHSSSSKQFFESQEEHKEDDDEEIFEVDSENSMAWPDEFMDNVPEIGARITNVFMRDDKSYISIEFEDINKKDILSYIEELKGLGFNLRTVDDTTSHIISYMASNDKDYRISLAWSDNEGYIDYTK